MRERSEKRNPDGDHRREEVKLEPIMKTVCNYKQSERELVTWRGHVLYYRWVQANLPFSICGGRQLTQPDYEIGKVESGSESAEVGRIMEPVDRRVEREQTPDDLYPCSKSRQVKRVVDRCP